MASPLNYAEIRAWSVFSLSTFPLYIIDIVGHLLSKKQYYSPFVHKFMTIVEAVHIYIYNVQNQNTDLNNMWIKI